MSLKASSLPLLLVALLHLTTATSWASWPPEGRTLAKAEEEKCSITGQVFMECGTACPPTCADPNPSCTRQCVMGCQCPSGMVLDKNRCVLPEHCEKECRIPGQVYMECGTACPPTCVDPSPSCTRQCVKHCQCPSGTVLHRDSCILPEHCEKKCSTPGQVYMECGTACPPTCADPNPPCNRLCVSHCQCRSGTVLHRDRCVLPEHCEKKCSIPGQVFMDCGTACPPTCADPNPSCTRQCVRGCQCPSGTVLHKGRCVLPEHCEKECRIPGQVYMECGTACPPTCADPNPRCTLQCARGCQCPHGTVLHRDRCVIPEHCEKKCSIPGQVYMRCGSACPPTCADPMPICTRQCVKGCQCPGGTLLEEDRCVLPENCP